MKYNILFLLLLFTMVEVTTAQVQTAASVNQNYIKTRTYTHEDGSKWMDAVQYFDGLGRPVQQVQVGVTPAGKDLVTYQEYDAFGREDTTWLPAPVAGNNGAFIPFDTYKTKPAAMYGATEKPYAYPVYETSPLNRLEQQFGPGRDWHLRGKSVKTAYLTNNASFVVPYFTTTDDKTTVSITRSGNYSDGQLHVIETMDEDGNKSYQATDVFDRLVYTKQMDGNTAVETCYIYDNFGNLRCVLPPLAIFASGTWTESTQNFNYYAYAYKYDKRNRCIAKKIPGAGWIYFVYDKADQLIFTQDGENRLKGEWQFSIPDVFGRVVLTGTCKNTYSYTSDPLSGILVTATRTNSTNTYKAYTIAGVTLTTPAILTVNYYDNYSFMGYNSIPNDINTQYNTETGYGVRYTTNYKGLLTGILTAQLTGNGTISPTYLYSVMYYDKKGQLIQTKSNNHLPGGIEKEYFAYDFTGQPTAKKKVHSATGKATQTEIYSYTYDHAGRLTNSTHNWNGITNTLADNTYDELGRLKTNHKGGSYANSKLKTTYGYNIRSWTTSISSPLYVENLYYNSVTSPGLSPVACYNGNLSGISWQFYDSPDPFGCGQLGYNFFYDNLSRLKDAKFWRCGSDNQTDDRSMYLTYDKHGNIATLERYGNLTATTYGKIDHLRGLVYYGNQLNRVLDYGSKVSYEGSMDFKDHIDMYNEYTYNANGAMTKDLNKGINIIQYNSLNLPMLMDVKSPVAEARNEYTYSATGNKLKVTQKYNPNFSTTPVIGSAINTSLLTMNKTTDYVGNIVYEDGALKRILVDGGYIEWGQRFYYITGHLGNNNLVLHGDGSVKQRNQYYPFGMNFASDAAQGYQPYKYNGKELDKTLGVNLYDYLARWLDPSGRFTTIDPHAEKYYSISPYAAFMNNPINVIDPDGRDAYYLTDDGRMVLALKNDDKYDTLHGKNKDLTSKGDPLKVNDKNLLPQLSGLNGDSKGAMTANGADAFNIFKFAADNSNVEWSLSGFKNEGEMNYYLNTQFSDAQASMGDNYAFKREDMLFNVHSHSRENATKGGSGYSINPDGTLARVSEDGLNAKDFYIERGNKIMPLYVYHRHTKGLYQYTPWNKAARTWRNIQSGKRMKSIINP